MPDHETVVCAQCGEIIPLQGGLTKGFCLHCGAPFSVAPAPESDSEHARALFEQREWRALSAYTELSEEGAQRMLNCAAELHLAYDEYVEAAGELAKTSARRSLTKLLTGRNAFSEDEMHGRFYADMEAGIGRLAECAAGANTALAKAVAEDIAVRVLLHERDQEDPLYWSFVAMQHKAIPLFAFLDAEILLRIYQDFEQAHPGNLKLPNQIEVKNALTQRIQALGGRVPGRKLFGRK